MIRSFPSADPSPLFPREFRPAGREAITENPRGEKGVD